MTGDQVYRGTAVGGEDIQHYALHNTAGTEIGTNAVPVITRDTLPGYAPVAIYAEVVAGVTTEALVSLIKVTSGVAAAAATSISPAAGKNLIIEEVWIQAVATSTALNLARARIRLNPGGAVALTSAIVFTARSLIGTSAAAAGQGHLPVNPSFGRGIMLPNGGGLGISHVAGATSYTLDVTLRGYELNA